MLACEMLFSFHTKEYMQKKDAKQSLSLLCFDVPEVLI